MEKRELVCVACPLGCPITVTLEDNNNVTDVTGNTCKREMHTQERNVQAPQECSLQRLRLRAAKRLVLYL